jgi:hypothetical protein
MIIIEEIYSCIIDDGIMSAHAKTTAYAACGNNRQERDKIAGKT